MINLSNDWKMKFRDLHSLEYVATNDSDSMVRSAALEILESYTELITDMGALTAYKLTGYYIYMPLSEKHEVLSNFKQEKSDSKLVIPALEYILSNEPVDEIRKKAGTILSEYQIKHT